MSAPAAEPVIEVKALTNRFGEQAEGDAADENLVGTRLHLGPGPLNFLDRGGGASARSPEIILNPLMVQS